ncbi:MAG: hypothetical protein ACKVP2_12745, partial [Burkholderiales bacterium]
PTKTQLVIFGTDANDKIRILPAKGEGGHGHCGDDDGRDDDDRKTRGRDQDDHDDRNYHHDDRRAQSVEVWINGISQGVYAPTGRIIVLGLAGNDDIEVAGGVRHDVVLRGGEGNDRLKAGGGTALLLGEAGDDMLIGGNDRDILIGGLGADRLIGGAGEDILIAGSTVHDNDAHALCLIMREWTQDDCYGTRVDHLKNGGGLNGTVRLNACTVQADDSVDRLTGAAGKDWIFADCGDKVTDEHSQSGQHKNTHGHSSHANKYDHGPRKDHGHNGHGDFHLKAPVIDWGRNAPEQKTTQRSKSEWKGDFVNNLALSANERNPNQGWGVKLPASEGKSGTAKGR